jgi:hypothetical protein
MSIYTPPKAAWWPALPRVSLPQREERPPGLSGSFTGLQALEIPLGFDLRVKLSGFLLGPLRAGAHTAVCETIASGSGECHIMHHQADQPERLETEDFSRTPCRSAGASEKLKRMFKH